MRSESEEVKKGRMKVSAEIDGYGARAEGKRRRRKGWRGGRREERSEGCWDSELASNGV